MFTSEVKFVVDESIVTEVRLLTSTAMIPDAHAVERGDRYQTTTLYFDTQEFDLYFRRGSNGRAKFRIRRYNGAPDVFLERKMKVDRNRLYKRRSKANAADLLHLAEPDRAWPGTWFARRLQN